MTTHTRFLALGLAFLGVMAVRPAGQAIGDSARRPDRTLSADDIGDIATLLRLEDTRQFDEAELRRILASGDPEVRRRAVVSIGRIAKPEGSALLDTARKDEVYTIVASAAFAAGQLKDPAAVVWLDKMLSPETDTSIAREAAQALGKIRGPEARASLARYLNTVAESSKTRLVIGEALLSMGRFAAGEDLAPIVRWATSKDVEIRPVAIDYGAARADIGWWEEPGRDNVLRILGRRGALPVTVQVLVPLGRTSARKQLAREAREKIAEVLGFKSPEHSPIGEEK